MALLLIQDYQSYGIDWDGPVPAIEDETAVNVPKVNCPLNNDDQTALTGLINPLNQSNSFGIDVYIQTVNFISQRLGCPDGFHLM